MSLDNILLIPGVGESAPNGFAQLSLTGGNAYGTPIGTTQVLRGSETYGTYRQPRQARMYRFDGTDDFCLRASSLSLTDFTLACWIEPENTVNRNLFGDSINSDYIRFSSNGASIVIRSNNANTTINLSDFFWLNEVAHFAITRSGSTVTVYKNGVQVGQVTHNATAFGFRRVGTWSGGTQCYKGRMAALKVYTVAKSTSEIAAIAAEVGTLADTTDISAYYPMIEESGTTCYDAYGSADLTITNADTTLGGTFHVTSNQLRFNPANIVGYTTSGDVVVPRDEANPTQDAAGGALGKTGAAPNPIAVHRPCLTFDGTGYISIADLVGAETVTESSGTSTLSVAAGRVDGTAGTCFGFTLSSGHQFVLEEGNGTTVYNVGSGDDGTLTSFAAPWAAKTVQAQSWRVLYGGRVASGAFVPGETIGNLCVDGEPKTLSAGKVCGDGGLTTVNFNPFSKAENNRLELPTAWDGDATVLSQVVPLNTKFARVKSDGVDRLASYFSPVRPSRSYFDLSFVQTIVTLPTDFNAWNLCDVYKRDSMYVANETADRVMPVTDQTLYVATTGNDGNDGSIGSPKLTISGALSAATGVPLVVVGAGTFSGAGITRQCLIEGAGPTTIISGATVATQYVGLRDCKFTNVLTNSGGRFVLDGVAFESSGADAITSTGAARTLMFGCSADGCTADVYDYNGTAQGLEADCTAGTVTPNGSISGHNATTGHNDSRIVRIRGTYQDSPNPVHDVNNCRSLLFDCTVTGGSGFNLGAASSGIADEYVRIWVYGGDLSGGATYDIETDADGIVYVDSDVQYSTTAPGSKVEAF